MNKAISNYISALEDKAMIDPACEFCNEDFYPKLKEGIKMNQIFAPRHRASDKCESGSYNHCTCDSCF